MDEHSELVAELRSRYMDTKKMLPCELEHRAADAITDLQSRVKELDALSVTNIMVEVVPWGDGMGEEVYAKSLDDVFKVLNRLSEQAEELASVQAERDALRQELEAIRGQEPGWISAAERQPELDTPVWLFEPGRGMWVGELSYTGDGWLYVNTYGSHYSRPDGTWSSTSNDVDDDYQPTHWKPLPLPPSPKENNNG
jgi:hypothetical protein